MQGILVLAIFLMLSLLTTPTFAEITVEATRVGDSSHFEFRGASQWKWDLKSVKSQKDPHVLLRLPKLAPETLNILRSHSDAMVRSVSVDTDGVDESVEIKFHLASPDVDSFEYLTEQPSQLVVDFFIQDEEADNAVASEKEAPTAPEAKIEVAAKPAKPSKLPQIAKSLPKKRDPAATEFIQNPSAGPTATDVAKLQDQQPIAASDLEFQRGIFDGGDPEFRRFSIQDYEIRDAAIISARRNLYIPFPMLRLREGNLDTILKNQPQYEIEEKAGQENAEARLLLTLFKNKRIAVFLKSAKEFLQRHPDSEYDEIVKYMIADTYYDFWRKDAKPPEFDEAITLYRGLIEHYPKSPLGPRTTLLLGYSYLQRQDSFSAIKSFQRFLRENPDSKLKDQAKIAIASAYLNLNRYDESLKILDEVEATAANKHDAIEAAYRKGDIFFQKHDLSEATTRYKYAQKKYPDAWRDFPNAYYNLAEAQFWSALKGEDKQGFKNSIESYREFLKRFPDHTYCGFALVRIGETLDLLGADGKRVLGAYMEDFFRYRATPGAAIARMRVLTARMHEMKEKELKDALKEIDALAKNTKLEGLEEFITFLLADGHYRRGDYEKSTKMLVRHFQRNPNTNNQGKLRERIVRNINESIRKSVEANDFIQSLRIYSQYRGSWLKDSDRVDTQFYIGRAYEHAGVYDESAGLFRTALNQLYAVKGTEGEKEKNVFEALPSTDSLCLRLASVAVKERDYAKALGYLKDIKAPAQMSEAEQVERVELSAQVAEMRGQVDTAIGYIRDLLATWRGQPAMVAPLYLRLARMHRDSKDLRAAETDLAKLINLHTDTQAVSEDLHAAALEMRGDLLRARGRRQEAVKAYRELLDQYENTRPLNSVRYRAGQILYEQGDLKGAESLWAELKQENGDIWAKLAAEQMQSAKWKNEYKKYIERIPAMSGMRSDSGREDSQTQ